VVIAGQIFVYDELPKVESTTELLVSRAEAPLARRTLRTARNGCVLMAQFENSDEPEVVAVVPLLNLSVPSAYPRI
jgi:hypothetical protein